MASPVYYFGCWNQAGHYLHEPGGNTVFREAVGPFTGGMPYGDQLPLDGTFAPGPNRSSGVRNIEDETAVALTHIRGWTVLAMWDRSVDTRGACNAAFIAEGSNTMAEMWALARQHFPQVVQRLKAAAQWTKS